MSIAQYNTELPLVMHVDLNSAFATTEQQARPRLRGKPVAVLNRRTEHTAIVTASYEAKARGVKVGMRFRDAAKLAPGLIGVESDPAKYRYVHKKLRAILASYSPNFVMKSIDEGVIDFHGVPLTRSLETIGLEIKQRLKEEVGDYMRCNIGIAPNRFLAKTAAGLHKPDGLDIITHENLRDTFSTLKIQDLTGIAHRNAKRLASVGIYTPLEFLDADMETLEKIVFKSIDGRAWYQRLRGFEVDDREFEMQRIGRQYVLESRNLTREQILERLHNLCESVGARMRAQDRVARGVYVYAKSYTKGYWHSSRLMELPFFSDQALYRLAAQLFVYAPDEVREIGVHVYHLERELDHQLTIFGDTQAREQRLMGALDEVNGRYGARTLHAAHSLPTDGFLYEKIPFGSTRFL